ncbi:hypothetical protein [Streptomyces griseoaurantiacus]|uniref:hypothetical protein n=1 Tax=Streptomyces griseoaurantiacus TaxID=68213 RepID=UPI0036903B5D
MDPVTAEQLVYELGSVNAQCIYVPVEKLVPGQVLAGGEFDHHVITSRPYPMPGPDHTVALPVRHLHGGQNVKTYIGQGSDVAVYRSRMGQPTGTLVPVVPPCVIPEAPAKGDRIVLQHHRADALGVNRFHLSDGSEWSSVAAHVVHGRVRRTVRQFEDASMRAIVSAPNARGWYVYLPAGHTPHLYIDGRPVPARTARQLYEGDTLLVPGGGRLLVEKRTPRGSGASTLSLRVLKPSRHQWWHLTWASRNGDVITHKDSGQGTLYACEPRPAELLSAAELYPGDTVIAAWGTPYTNVATVDEVWRQPVRAAMHVHSTTTDGQHVRTQTGFDNRYILLHRTAPDYSVPVDRSALARYAF